MCYKARLHWLQAALAAGVSALSITLAPAAMAAQEAMMVAEVLSFPNPFATAHSVAECCASLSRPHANCSTRSHATFPMPTC